MAQALTEEQVQLVKELQSERSTLTEEQRNVLARYEARMPKASEGGMTDLMIQSAASLSGPPSTARAVGNFVKPAILPTIGSMAGRAVGTAFPVLGPATPMVGSGLGSGAGEAVNQLTGITEPSLGQIALSTGLPMAVEGAANLYRTGRVLSAAKGPEVLNKLAYPAAQGKVAGLASTKASGPLFEQAAQQGVTVPVEKTWKLINGVVNNPNISKVEKQAFTKVLKDTGLSEFLTKDAAGLNPAKLQRVLSATGELIPSAEGYGGGHLKRLFGALSQDLDDAASGALKLTAQQTGMKEAAIKRALSEGVEITKDGNLVLYHGTKSAEEIGKSGLLRSGSFLASDKNVALRFAEQAQSGGQPNVLRLEVPPHTVFPSGLAKEPYWSLNENISTQPLSRNAAATLKEARDLFKREQVLKDIGDELSKAFTLNRGQEARQFNANKIVRTLEDSGGTIGKFFKQAFSPAEQKDLVGFFEFLNTIPVLKPGSGAQYGSGRLLARSVASMGAGGGMGFAMSGGNPVASAVGTVVGAAVPAADDMVRTGIQVWKMPGGKSLLRNVLNNSDGVLTPQVLSTIAAFATAKTATPPPEVSRAGTLRPLPTAR